MAKSLFPYQQVRRHIMDHLELGLWKPGDLLPAEVKLAAQLSVHRLTVNRVMCELVNEGLLVRRRGVGTIVSGKKRRLTPALGKGLVGLLTGHHFNPATNSYYGVIFEEMRKLLDARGLYIIPLGDAEDFFKKSSNAADGSIRDSLSAIVLLGAANESVFRELENFDHPAIVVGVSEYNGPLKHVVTDDAADAGIVANKLMDLGHTKIVHLNAVSPQRMHTRLQGFLSACEERGHAIPFRYVVEARSLEVADAKAAMLDFLDRGLPFTAVIGGNDNLALGAIAALNKRGIDVPEQVSVVGFDGIDAALHSIPPLTTMKVSRRRLAERAVELIVAACSGSTASSESGNLRSTWMEGGTLAPPPTGSN